MLNVKRIERPSLESQRIRNWPSRSFGWRRARTCSYVFRLHKSLNNSKEVRLRQSILILRFWGIKIRQKIFVISVLHFLIVSRSCCICRTKASRRRDPKSSEAGEREDAGALWTTGRYGDDGGILSQRAYSRGVQNVQQTFWIVIKISLSTDSFEFHLDERRFVCIVCIFNTRPEQYLLSF